MRPLHCSLHVSPFHSGRTKLIRSNLQSFALWNQLPIFVGAGIVPPGLSLGEAWLPFTTTMARCCIRIGCLWLKTNETKTTRDGPADFDLARVI